MSKWAEISMNINKKGLPSALLNRVAFWAVVLGCIAALIANKGNGAGSSYAAELFSFISVGVSVGALLGLLQYFVYRHKAV